MMIQFGKKITFRSHTLNLCKCTLDISLKFIMQKFQEVVSYKMSYCLPN
jgi:hypothetical protein